MSKIRDIYRICEENGAVGAWLCLLTSISLLIGSAIVPPLFVVDASILAAVGELFAFATLWKLPNIIGSIKDGKSLVLKKGETEIKISDNENKNTNDN